MAYKINNTFGTLLVTLADGTIDTATTDLSLIGKGYAGFGEALNENLIKLLENFNNTSAPANKMQGQMWYDKTNNQIKIYNGSKWKAMGTLENSTSAPTDSVTGDLWFDTANTQLYVYTGSAWTLIGPTTVAGSGVTQIVTESPEDNTGVKRSILKFVTNDTVVGVVSNLAFTPSSTETLGAALVTAGFSTIAQGIQLSSAVSSAKFRGTATDSDALGGVVAANFLRSDQDDTTTGRLTVQTDSGLRIGAGSDITMTLSSDDFTIAQTTQDKDIIFTVNDGGTTKEALRINGAAGRIDHLRVGDLTVDGTQTIINTSKLSVEDNIIELNRNISSNAGMPNYTGLKVNRGNSSTGTEQDLFWVWDETFADTSGAGGAWTAFKSTNVGGTEMSAPTLVDIRANIVNATSTSARYADLAERYETDMPIEVGDVVILGGSAEITKCMDEYSDQVFGVISESPALLMNAQAGDNDSHPMVALKGRVKVKLNGTGKAGDRVVSAGNGEARVANLDECTAFNTIGRLIKHKYTQETALTECVIGVK
jgi:hypothetical protein